MMVTRLLGEQVLEFYIKEEDQFEGVRHFH